MEVGPPESAYRCTGADSKPPQATLVKRQSVEGKGMRKPMSDEGQGGEAKRTTEMRCRKQKDDIKAGGLR